MISTRIAWMMAGDAGTRGVHELPARPVCRRVHRGGGTQPGRRIQSHIRIDQPSGAQEEQRTCSCSVGFKVGEGWSPEEMTKLAAVLPLRF